ncbi:uridine kinase URK1 [Nakaseomyces bracarensis]|uniref:uridine kinase URK1 n=1 Tax=Nakaseomyces bracarensis TaxID=273131 RepID=UPI00387204DC
MTRTKTTPRRRSSVLSRADQHQYFPPWTTPYIIGVGGTSGSGKTSVANKIVSSINVPWTVLVSLDNFYKPLSPEERKRAFNNEYDFDEPSAIDLDLAYECILNLKEGKKTTIPVYSFVNHNRDPDKHIQIYGASVIVIEGIYALYDQRLLDLMDLKIYVDADLDICLARRLARDIVSRGRDLDGCLLQWERYVKPDAVKYVQPTMNNADAIVPSVSDNSVAVGLLINHIESKLEVKSEEHINELVRLGHSDLKPLKEYANLNILPQTNQVKAIHTILIDRSVDRADFVFYFDRIATILIANALNDVPIERHYSITTPEGYELKDQIKCHYESVTAISTIRSGDCFMSSLKKAIPNMSVGKLLIQSDSQTGEPQLHCEFIPSDITRYGKVLIFEAQIISGAAMIMAIQVLLDHKVKLESIHIVVYMATELGTRRILNAFGNKVKISAAVVVTKAELKNHKSNWALTRFVDNQYFGCE